MAFVTISPVPRASHGYRRTLCTRMAVTPASAPAQTELATGARVARVGILGASGYTGAELLRLLSQHPCASVEVLTGERSAGKTIGSVYPQFAYGKGAELPDLIRTADADYSGLDVVFACLPHAATQEIVQGLPSGLRVVDLSADFRLKDVSTYEEWYGRPHQAPSLQSEAVYGLTELARAAVADARLVANPGCYPTAAQLPLIPLLRAGLIQDQGIVIDAKSGATGAGRAPKTNTLFCEVTDGVSAYGVGSHRHAPEIEQGLGEASGKDITVTFTPHLLPMARGILETIYVTMRGDATVQHLRDCLSKQYDSEPFVHLLAPGESPPQTRHVRGSNHCVMQVVADRAPGRAIIVSCIDNVVKGASGQAVQNMNVMLGYPETLGLEQPGVFP